MRYGGIVLGESGLAGPARRPRLGGGGSWRAAVAEPLQSAGRRRRRRKPLSISLPSPRHGEARVIRLSSQVSLCRKGPSEKKIFSPPSNCDFPPSLSKPNLHFSAVMGTAAVLRIAVSVVLLAGGAVARGESQITRRKKKYL